MHIADLPIEDYFNLPNALRDGPEVDATVSFDVVWGGPVTRRVEVENGTNGDRFAGEFEEDHATVTWSGRNELGFTFRSDPGDFSTSAPGRAFAEIGRERNGAFFGEGEEGEGAGALARGRQGEASATDRFFAAFSQGRGEGQTPATSRPESGFAGDTAKGATAARAHLQTAGPPTAGPALFTEAGLPDEGAPFR